MRLVVEELTSNILHVQFDSYESMVRHLLRFQEYVEHPKFKHKIFTAKQYQKWYSEEYGPFNQVFDDWAGCNIPKRAFVPFFDGKFNPLSREEKKILNLLEPYRNTKFYLITSVKGDPSAFKHELAHGLYNTDKKYKETVTNILDELSVGLKSKMTDELRGMQYTDPVIADEIHAYLIDGVSFFKSIMQNPKRFNKRETAEFKKKTKQLREMLKDTSSAYDIPLRWRR